MGERVDILTRIGSSIVKPGLWAILFAGCTFSAWLSETSDPNYWFTICIYGLTTLFFAIEWMMQRNAFVRQIANILAFATLAVGNIYPMVESHNYTTSNMIIAIIPLTVVIVLVYQRFKPS